LFIRFADGTHVRTIRVGCDTHLTMTRSRANARR
jgi:hypothetical protein